MSDYNQTDKNANISGLASIRKYNDEVQPNDDLLNRLKTTIPEFFDKDNNFKMDKFNSELKKNNISEAHDGYKLGFVGKDYARLQVGLKSETMIVPDCKHNSLPENANSGNIFITGDNLDALRHLVNAYEKQIKLIYVDPPYNTGEEFSYPDTFEFTDEKLFTILGYTDEEITRLKSIQGKSSHSAWLTFMYPRLKIAQSLLKDDGVIFISIDDNEQANLKLLMDEVFGEGNFVAGFIREAIKGGSQSEFIREVHDHILVYAKKKVELDFIGFEKDELELNLSDENGMYAKGRELNKWGAGSRREDSPSMWYPIKGPDGIAVFPIRNDGSEGRWRLGKTKMNYLVENNGIIFEKRENGTYIAYEKLRGNKSKYTQFISILKDKYLNAKGTETLKELFEMERVIFDFSKPEDLIKDLLILSDTECNDLILDFFAGSSTTAHAVMQLNAEDGRNRKYIMVQLDEKTKQDSEARKAKFDTIDEISRERIRLAGKKILAEYESDLEKQTNGWNKDIGFKHYRLITPDIKTLEQIDTFNPDEPMLISDDMIKPFEYKETNTSGLDTLLTTWLIDDGFTFDTEIKELVFNKYKAQYIEEAGIIYLINREWDTAALKEMLNKIGKNELFAETIYVYPYSFDFEAMRELKTNVKNNLDNPPKII